jgi:hypothetical protein
MRPIAPNVKATAVLALAAFALTAHAADSPGQQQQEDSKEGWVRVAVDTNHDGEYDRVEWLFGRDLERARRASEGRESRPVADEPLAEEAVADETVADERVAEEPEDDKLSLREKLTQRERRADRPPVRERLAEREVDKPSLREKLRTITARIRELRAERQTLRERLAEAGSPRENAVARREALRERRADRERGDKTSLREKLADRERRRALRADRQPLRERLAQREPRTERDGERRIMRGYRPDRGSVEQEAEVQAPTPPAELHTVRGKLQDMLQIGLTGEDEQYVVARIETEDAGKPRVVLGPVSQLAAFNLEEGHELTIEGSLGRINQRAILFARYITLNGQQVHVRLPGGHDLARVRGQIAGLRTEMVEGHDEPHVIAEVQLVSGRPTTVCLGPESKLQELGLEPGKDVALLIRSGHLNREPIVIAEQIQVDGQRLEMDHPGHEHHHADAEEGSNE